MGVQYNVVSSETLRAAKKNLCTILPEVYG